MKEVKYWIEVKIYAKLQTGRSKLSLSIPVTTKTIRPKLLRAIENADEAMNKIREEGHEPIFKYLRITRPAFDLGVDFKKEWTSKFQLSKDVKNRISTGEEMIRHSARGVDSDGRSVSYPSEWCESENKKHLKAALRSIEGLKAMGLNDAEVKFELRTPDGFILETKRASNDRISNLARRK